MQGNISQSLLNYARIAWGKALKDSKKESTFDDVLAKFDMVGGGENGLVYHKWNDRIVWHIRVPNVGIVNQG